jgi:micrococcal nuclease
VDIQYNPPGSDVAREHVTVLNTGAPQQLEGWTLSDAAGHRFKFPAIVLPGGERLRVWTGAGHPDAENLFWGRKQAVWNNTGDTATLSDATGAIVNTFAYAG